MKRLIYSSFFIFLLQIQFNNCAYTCTGVRVNTPNGILVGGNEDYNSTYRDVIARVRPAVVGSYGYIGTGFERHDYFMMGVNDQGLFLDMFTVPSCFSWTHDPNKLDYDGFVEGELIRKCANIDEAIDFFDQYNFPSMGTYPYQIFVADSSGASAIISWTDEGIQVIKSQDDNQIVTNFYLSHPECGYYPCWRYSYASQECEGANEYSFQLVHDILGHTTLNSNYSQITNLRNGDITIFYNHDFDECIRFNLYKELKQGRYDYMIADYCCELNLVSPGNGITITESTTAVLNWEGVACAGYQVFISDDPNFTDCDPITDMSHYFSASVKLVPGFFLVVILLGLFSLKKFKHYLLRSILFLIMFICFLCSCEKDKSVQSKELDYSIKSYSKTISDLTPNTTYYWKIQSRISGRIYSESIVNSFTTGK